ncbi:Uncharacterised protein [uncultured archaeon]|nr:Uncharacterised protein [uncultured archaeon]
MADAKNPVLAGILNIIPGLGTWLICKNGGKGLKLFVIAIVLSVLSVLTLGLLSILSLIYTLVCIYDGYMEAQGKPVLKL